MNWYKVFYLVSVADRLQVTFITLAVIVGLLAMLFFIIWATRKYKDVGRYDVQIKEQTEKELIEKYGQKGWKRFMRWFRFLIVSFLTFLVLAVATPSKKDMIMIIAGGSVANFVTSDSSARALPSELTNYLRVEIKKMTDEAGVEMRKTMNMPTMRDTLINKSKEELIQLLEKSK